MDIPSPKLNYMLVKVGRILRELPNVACSFLEVQSFNTYGCHLFSFNLLIYSIQGCKLQLLPSENTESFLYLYLASSILIQPNCCSMPE